MIKRKRSINSIIHDQLLGYASEEDKKQLQSWLDSSQENRENYDRLMREACLIDRYKQFAQVDEARAWERFQKKHFSIRSARWIKIGRYAAIFLLPIIGFAIWFWTLRLMDSQPVISDEVRIAMIRSEKMGKQKATLVLANGQKMDLKSVPAKPLQDSVEQVPVAQPSVPKTDMNESEEVPVVENNKLSTYDDSEFWMTFEDGTRVHLNYNTTLKSKRLLDESSEEMLDIIFSNKIIDLANIFNWDDCIQYYNQMIMGAGNAVVSFMESRESRMQAGIDQTIELFRKLN